MLESLFAVKAPHCKKNRQLMIPFGPGIADEDLMMVFDLGKDRILELLRDERNHHANSPNIFCYALRMKLAEHS
jgi:hypothetical protein